MEKFFKLLKTISIALACLVFILAAFALVKKLKLKNNQPAAAAEITIEEKNPVLFGDIGTLRAVTKDKATVVITPYIEYDKTDTAFQEELVKKKQDIRETVTAYFSIRTANEIRNTTENQIKTQILDLLNELFTLNKIKKIYFENFLILD